MIDMEVSLAAPLQCLLNLVVLLEKAAGGDRPITIASSFYALWSEMRSAPLAAWEREFVEFWDDAIVGSSALQVALLRRLLDEIQVRSGGFTATFFWDMEKFYDSVVIDSLLGLAGCAGYPLDMLSIDV